MSPKYPDEVDWTMADRVKWPCAVWWRNERGHRIVCELRQGHLGPHVRDGIEKPDYPPDPAADWNEE